MNTGIKCLIAALVLAAAGVAAAAERVNAPQAYPTRPVRLIVPYPPGGGNDTLARLLGQKLTESWGQQVVVDKVNRDFVRILDLPDIRERLKQLGSEGAGSTPSELARFVRAESAKYSKAIRESGIKAE